MMEVQITRTELSKGLSLIQNVVEKRNTMPILSNVLLTASEGVLKVSATDLEIAAIAQIQSKVNRAGSTTVNARVLCDIVRELPEEDVTLKVGEGERLEIVSGSSRMRIIGVSAEEYPSLPGVALAVISRVSAQQFAEMISKTIYAVSTDETRFNLTGVSFEIVSGEEKKQNSLRMVATDGHRLAMITRPIDGLNFSGAVLVPRKGLVEIKKLLDEEGGDVGIGVQEGFLIVETPSAKVAVRLIDGEFPDYKQVLPKKEGETSLIGVKALSDALRRVSLLVSDKAKGVRLDFTQNMLRISSSSPELGDAYEEMPIEYQHKGLTVGFNAKYLIDLAASLSEETRLKVELHGELGPGKFSAEGDESYFGIVMPMRLV